MSDFKDLSAFLDIYCPITRPFLQFMVSEMNEDLLAIYGARNSQFLVVYGPRNCIIMVISAGAENCPNGEVYGARKC